MGEKEAILALPNVGNHGDEWFAATRSDSWDKWFASAALVCAPRGWLKIEGNQDKAVGWAKQCLRPKEPYLECFGFPQGIGIARTPEHSSVDQWIRPQSWAR